MSPINEFSKLSSSEQVDLIVKAISYLPEDKQRVIISSGLMVKKVWLFYSRVNQIQY